MKENEDLINQWRDICTKNGNIPIALVCIDKDDFPIVYTIHDAKIMHEVWKHLANSPLLGKSTHFEDREN